MNEEQFQTYHEVREMFPTISRKYLRDNAARRVEDVVHVILDGQAPQTRGAISDTEEDAYNEQIGNVPVQPEPNPAPAPAQQPAAPPTTAPARPAPPAQEPPRPAPRARQEDAQEAPPPVRPDGVREEARLLGRMMQELFAERRRNAAPAQMNADMTSALWDIVEVFPNVSKRFVKRLLLEGSTHEGIIARLVRADFPQSERQNSLSDGSEEDVLPDDFEEFAADASREDKKAAIQRRLPEYFQIEDIFGDANKRYILNELGAGKNAEGIINRLITGDDIDDAHLDAFDDIFDGPGPSHRSFHRAEDVVRHEHGQVDPNAEPECEEELIPCARHIAEFDKEGEGCEAFSPEEEEELEEEQVPCHRCPKTAMRGERVRCHALNQPPNEGSHYTCTKCLKMLFVVQKLKRIDHADGIKCINRTCNLIITREDLYRATKSAEYADLLCGGQRFLLDAKAKMKDADDRRVRMQEPMLTQKEAKEYSQLFQLVGAERMEELRDAYPRVSYDWLLRHADSSNKALDGMWRNAPVRKPARRDRKGITSFIEKHLKTRLSFECSVCFVEYDDHLSIMCSSDGDTNEERHKFCADCVKGHAETANTQPVIVSGGAGLKCMDPGCKSTLLRAHIAQVLNVTTMEMLEPLLDNEVLLAANINAEKCKRCPFAMLYEEPPEVEQIFHCHRCNHQHCRRCGRDWDAKHSNRTCDELDPDAQRRRVEEELSKAAMRKCARCSRPYLKTTGCNKIICPCGAFNCYLCQKLIPGYEHFNDPSNPCNLYDAVDLERNRNQVLEQEINRADLPEIRAQVENLR